MSYIGKTPTVGNFIKLDALTASATASYTMQHGGVNFQPESALHMLVSLNGVIQSPNTSFTISGSTITFSSALTSSDSIDFIIVYGNVLDIGTPSDATVTDAKANFVSTSSAAGLQIKGDGTTDGTLQLNCSQNSHGIKLKSPAHSAGASYTLTFPTTDGNANQFLQTNGSGVLTWADAGGNTPAFRAFHNTTQNVSNTTLTTLSFNSETFDSDGTYDTSNGRFTPAVAGKYFLFANVRNDDTNVFQLELEIRTSEENAIVKFSRGNSSGAGDSFSVFTIADLSATEYAFVTAYHSQGGTRTMLGGTTEAFFGGFKLGGA